MNILGQMMIALCVGNTIARVMKARGVCVVNVQEINVSANKTVINQIVVRVHKHTDFPTVFQKIVSKMKPNHRNIAQVFYPLRVGQKYIYEMEDELNVKLKEIFGENNISVLTTDLGGHI